MFRDHRKLKALKNYRKRKHHRLVELVQYSMLHIGMTDEEWINNVLKSFMEKNGLNSCPIVIMIGQKCYLVIRCDRKEEYIFVIDLYAIKVTNICTFNADEELKKNEEMRVG
ncbi:hypothetical protein LOAG_02807 [Loa loa]|uniref:Uncharacterized protein n=1 Tax=Loa loa TaxID=7209 RepID=A0A1S0U6C4_LOALO|nr:hypothetical protein LOAG_02807 [Loa loa]EFO25680.1 hypothetical protein LOAG_02807 [Loa loa]